MTSLPMLIEMIVNCLNYGSEDNFIDRECLVIDMEQAVNTI